jgi:hypothetical protein
MKRVTTRFVVELLITIAFLVTVASGLVMTLPGHLMQVSPNGYPSFLGVSLLGWLTIHKWSVLALTVVVVTHVVLNRRRVAGRVSRLARPGEPPQATRAPVSGPSQGSAEGLS